MRLLSHSLFCFMKIDKYNISHSLELAKIEYWVKVAYREYRKILINLELYNELLDIDLLYNSKLRKGDRMRVYPISKSKERVF